MKCPNDETVLVMSDRQGIEIDYCPACRGVWLDRGELDKLIERSIGAAGTVSAPANQPDRGGAAYDASRHDQRDDYGEERRYAADGHYKKRKKESFLGDLFDF